MASKKTNESTFENDVLKSSIPVIVDFWAEWCGPCKQIGPILEEISDEKKDSLNVFKLNVDENPEIAQKYNVRGIPTLIFFNKGNLIDQKIGSMSKTMLLDWIESILNK